MRDDFTLESLMSAGYQVCNAKIVNSTLTLTEGGAFYLSIDFETEENIMYYRVDLGTSIPDVHGAMFGVEFIMKIMQTVEVNNLFNLKGNYIRVAINRRQKPELVIGNIIKDRWIGFETYWDDDTEFDSDDEEEE